MYLHRACGYVGSDMKLDYVQERISELEIAIMKVSYLPKDALKSKTDMFNFYNGQLHVWQEVRRSMTKVSA